MLYGAPFAVPLGLATRVIGAGDDLGTALERVAHQGGDVVVIDPTLVQETEELDQSEVLEDESYDDTPHARASLRDPRPLLAVAIAKLASLAPARRAEDDLVDDVDRDVDEELELEDIDVDVEEEPGEDEDDL